jgi:hypothetical protein
MRIGALPGDPDENPDWDLSGFPDTTLELPIPAHPAEPLEGLDGPPNAISVIYTAETPEGVRDILNEILSNFEANVRILIVVDVDDTLIKGGSDIRSWMNCGNLSQMEVINRPLLEVLSQPLAPNIKVLVLTGARVYALRLSESADVPGSTSRVVDLTPISIPAPDSTMRPSLCIRSEAMAQLVPASLRLFGPGEQILLPVLGEPKSRAAIMAQPTSRISPHSFQSFDLGPTLQGDPRFQDYHIFQHAYLVSFTKNSHNYHLQDLDNPDKYRAIIAWPVCINGTVFLNPFSEMGGICKGDAICFFIQVKIPQAEGPELMIAIDDQLVQLESMQVKCREMNIGFIGILCLLPNSPPMWFLRLNV